MIIRALFSALIVPFLMFPVTQARAAKVPLPRSTPEAQGISYRGDGAAGQVCVVIPDKDVVVAITADTGNFQGEMNAIWDELYPAFQPAALAEDTAAAQELRRSLATLQAHPAKNAK